MYRSLIDGELVELLAELHFYIKLYISSANSKNLLIIIIWIYS